jgi:hypothetical protein
MAYLVKIVHVDDGDGAQHFVEDGEVVFLVTRLRDH